MTTVRVPRGRFYSVQTSVETAIRLGWVAIEPLPVEEPAGADYFGQGFGDISNYAVLLRQEGVGTVRQHFNPAPDSSVKTSRVWTATLPDGREPEELAGHFTRFDAITALLRYQGVTDA